MITSKEAAQIAKRHGLTLSDANALSRLADSTEEADELAVMFADPAEDGREAAKDIPRL